MSAREEEPAPAPVGTTQRVDKWLWFVRVVKTRTQAASLVTGGLVRVNRVKVDKPSFTVRPGDVLTVGLRSHVRVLEVVTGGVRRGSSEEAAILFKDLTPPVVHVASAPESGERDAGAGRPTKRERRQLERFKRQDDESY